MLLDYINQKRSKSLVKNVLFMFTYNDFKQSLTTNFCMIAI